MYDKLHIVLRDKSVSNIDEISKRLDNAYPFNNYNRGYTGKLRNFKVTLTRGCLKLKGSLCKFFWGNNIRNICRLETGMAIIELSHILNLPIDKAKVTYLEFGQNFEMEYIPRAYFWHLGNHQRLERFEQPNSLYYKTHSGSRQYIFYDKIKEAKRIKIPNNMADQNLLRFEIRLKNLSKFNKDSAISCQCLYEKHFYKSLLDSYINSYLEIHKNPIVNLDYSLLETPTDCKEYFTMCFINKLSQNGAIAVIENMRDRKALKRNEYYSRMINYINNLFNKYKDVGRTPIIDELTTKVLALNNSKNSF